MSSSLTAALRSRLRGDVRDDAGTLATYASDASNHNRCTVGGMVGTNACGSHSVA